MTEQLLFVQLAFCRVRDRSSTQLQRDSPNQGCGPTSGQTFTTTATFSHGLIDAPLDSTSPARFWVPSRDSL